MKKSKQTAAAGVLSALSVVLMFFGSVVSVLSYIMPLLSGLLMIIAMESINRKTALSIYACVSLLSLFLLSDKECALLYAAFFGYYPIIRSELDKIKNRLLLWTMRVILFNVSIVFSQLICVFVFRISFDDFLGKWGIAVLLLLANLLFVMYEKLLAMLIVLYRKKYKSKINNLLK